MGDFSRIHPLPQSGNDVPDDMDGRLVVLGVNHPYSREPNSPAEAAAKAILDFRGNTPRLYQNSLVFLAVDKTRLQDLDEAVRRYLAWQSILAEANTLDLSPHQVRQAETQRDTADSVVTARLPEAYQWLLVPGQADPKAAVAWQAVRLSGQDALAVRASRKLKSDEALVTSFAPSRLRMDLDRVPLWRGDHVAVKQLVEDYARYSYLSRLKDSEVLLAAIRDGLGLLTWKQDAFAYADDWDEAAGRYRGLRAGVQVGSLDPRGLLVKPEVAARQLAEEARKAEEKKVGKTEVPVTKGDDVREGEKLPPPKPEPPRLRRFHGSVAVDPTRVGRDAGRIAEEIVQHLVGLAGADVEIHLEIQARIPDGAPENVVRIVTENCRTLKFKTHGFEEV